MFYPFKTLHHRNAIAQTAAPYFANIAPYQLATGTVPGPNGTNDRPVSCAGNANSLNCRAVVRNACPRKPHYTNAIDYENQFIVH